MANWQAIMDDVDAFAKKIGVRDPVIDLYLRHNLQYQRSSGGTYHLGSLRIGYDPFGDFSESTYAAKVDPARPPDYKQLRKIALEAQAAKRELLEALDEAAKEFLQSLTYVRVPPQGSSFALKWQRKEPEPVDKRYFQDWWKAMGDGML